MLGTAITTFITCFVLFVVMAVLVNVELVKGRRIFLVRVRGWIDGKIVSVARVVGESWHHFIEYVVRLGWYYSVHSLLRTILAMLVSAYTMIENVFEKNREKTKELRRKKKDKERKGHFSQIADHKAGVALSKEQQEQLLHDKLHHNH